MIYLLSIIIIAADYYTMTYGFNVLRKENNTLGGWSVILLSAAVTFVSIAMLFIRA